MVCVAAPVSTASRHVPALHESSPISARPQLQMPFIAVTWSECARTRRDAQRDSRLFYKNKVSAREVRFNYGYHTCFACSFGFYLLGFGQGSEVKDHSLILNGAVHIQPSLIKPSVQKARRCSCYRPQICITTRPLSHAVWQHVISNCCCNCVSRSEAVTYSGRLTAQVCEPRRTFL